MKRDLTQRLSVALFCGVAVFVILNLAAWYNLRGVRHVCPRQDKTRQDKTRQDKTRFILSSVSNSISKYLEQNQKLPLLLGDIQDLAWATVDNPEAPVVDDLGNSVRYRRIDSSFELFSYGRDGKPGGVGLDADLYHDGRNQSESLATLWQFFTEPNSGECIGARFVFIVLIAACISAFATFRSLGDLGRNGRQPMLFTGILKGLIVIVIASLMGVVLLPLHIPSGH